MAPKPPNVRTAPAKPWRSSSTREAHLELLLDALATLISLAFLAILGAISGVAIPGLFLVAAAPWLDWLLPDRKKQ